MKFNRFEEILVWQKSKVLTLEIYSLFSKINDFGFRDQICRAAISVLNNIAEGYERQTNKEFKHFLYIAKGSSGELRSMLYLAKDLNLISDSDFKNCFTQAEEISRMLSGLIKKL